MNNLSLGRYFSSIYRHQSIIINSLLKDLDISSGQYLFLIRIGANPGLTQKELSDMIHIDRANTNRAIKKLESLRLIHTEADEQDRRNKRSFLTDKGEETRMVLLQRLQAVTDFLAADIKEDELLQFITTIEKIEKNIQNAVTQLREDNDGN